jgi:hypothetical protein
MTKKKPKKSVTIGSITLKVKNKEAKSVKHGATGALPGLRPLGRHLKTTQAVNAVLTALRGPDLGDPEWYLAVIKEAITGRLRSIVLKGYPFGTYTSSPVNSGTVANVRGAVIKLRSEGAAANHFLEHAAIAVRHTSTHKIWGGYGDALQKILWGDL